MDAEPASGEGARDLSEEFRIGAQRVTLWCTETGLLSPFRPPYSGRICVRSIAQISFRTVSQEKFSGAAGLSFYEKYREALASGFSPCFEDRVLVGGVATHPVEAAAESLVLVSLHARVPGESPPLYAVIEMSPV